jgi:hypothetical protein
MTLTASSRSPHGIPRHCRHAQACACQGYSGAHLSPLGGALAQLVQLVLTDDQALLTRQAIDLALSNSTEDQIGDADADLQRLAVFFGAVAAEPGRFPLTGQFAEALKRGARKAKGPAQTKSRRNARKERQEKRIGFAKRRRAERRALVAQHNAVQEAMEAERQEMEEAYAELRARLDAEPKVNITDAAGNVILAGVPQSMVQPVDAYPPEAQGPNPTSIIMPGSAEALAAQLEAKS